MSNTGKRTHNAKTRWSNTKRTDTLWAIRQRVVQDKKSGDSSIVEENVYVPYDTHWDPDLLDRKNLPEPFDALKLDWMEELAHWITDNKYSLSRKQTGTGAHQYIVTDSDGKHMLTVESERVIMMEHRPHRRRRKRKTME